MERIFTASVEHSTLTDGTSVYVASLEEMPGVVCEGESPQQAVSQLIDSVLHLRDHLGLTRVGLRTPYVRDFKWG